MPAQVNALGNRDENRQSPEAQGPPDDPAGPADDPAGPADDPVGPADDPVGPADDPVGPADDPVGPADDPESLSESLCGGAKSFGPKARDKPAQGKRGTSAALGCRWYSDNALKGRHNFAACALKVRDSFWLHGPHPPSSISRLRRKRVRGGPQRPLPPLVAEQPHEMRGKAVAIAQG